MNKFNSKSRPPLTNSEKTEKLKQRDEKYQGEQDKIGQKPRFGLFSYPCGLDTNFDHQKPPHVLEQSTNFRSFKPKDRNFFTAKVKKGGLDQVLFSSPGYNTIGEPYRDPTRMKLRGESQNTRMGMHGKEFRPGGRAKKGASSDFLLTPNEEKLQFAGYRTTGPRGFFTSPIKHGIGPGTLIQKQNYGHMVDEYDRKRDLDREERRMRKTMQYGQPFRNVVKGPRTFGNDGNEYGEDGLNIAEKAKANEFKGLLHEKPFKYSNPPKTGYEKTINRFPNYKEEGGDLENGERPKSNINYLPWRPTYLRKSEPSDSITAHFKNAPKYSFM